jgi:CubicO group peptidase (beta-lactamase class C family)
LDALRDSLAAQKTRALLIVQRGQTVYEWYAPGNTADTKQGTASLAKAIVGGVSLMLAAEDGRIGIDDPAWKYIPSWKDDPLKSRITIRHLATHSSGIEDAEQDRKPHDQLTGWKGDFWKRTPDPFTIAIHQAPVAFEPGSRYAYSNPGMAALAYAVTASLRGAKDTDIRSLLKNRVLMPMGVADDAWSVGYGRAYEVDGMKLYANWGGGAFTPRATARIGEWMMKRSSSGWGKTAVSFAKTPLPARAGGVPEPASGLGWWTNFDGVWKRVPRDAFAGAGAQHQVMLVVPSLELIVVRNGGALGDGPFWSEIESKVFNPVMAALASPYPRSTVIREVTFAPEREIVVKAVDSDNWPITWGDDDAQYTSYGDGRGFEPFVEKKLSMGFARITGGPRDFVATNLRSDSGERLGDGRAGLKASGMLMAGGVLYMWVRNAGNAQLAWSQDRGNTWEWGFRFEESFGSPSFLNFGKNYAGARDGYVYTYSQEGGSAYESDDAVVLARAPLGRLRERASWEFFERVDDRGGPVWTRSLARRGAVFRYAGHCQRVDAVYNAGLKRYLLAVGYNHNGGWGLFDAPEPWGPWTQAFHTEYWGLGGTHGYRLPAKWISADGRRMELVFSGVRPWDAFCVRAIELR